MKILIIDNSPAFTGAFKCALNEALLLSPLHHFLFLVPEKSITVSLLQHHNITVYTLPLKEISKSYKQILQYPFCLLSNILKLRRVLKTEKIDILQVNDFYNLLGAGLKISGSKVKLITYVRFLPTSITPSLRRIWTKAAQLYSDKVIAVSDAVLQQLPQKENTIRIYDAVNMEEKYPSASLNFDLKQCLYLSNFTRGKGQEYALQAFALAYAENKKLRLKFVGGDLGLEKNRAFRKELEIETVRLGLSEVVTFADFEQDTERLIKTSYMLLNFSEAESFSMTCLEASYYGTPVIATKSGGPEEIITDGESGFLVDKKDVRSMVERMLRLCADEALREHFSNAGKIIVREKFSEKIYKEKFIAVLESLSK